MAKKVTGMVKLQIPAGKATPAPPVGTALGPHGVNIIVITSYSIHYTKLYEWWFKRSISNRGLESLKKIRKKTR